MKLHMCCGDIYLQGYLNCDIVGDLYQPGQDNPNETTLDKYFKYPFNRDFKQRVRRPFLVDKLMNILEPWPFDGGSVDEIVSVSAFEHFEHHTELPHIIAESYRVLRPGGVWKFDFPDIKKIVELYHDTDPEFCAEQIYCNHKNKYSVHQWGYTPKSVPLYLPPDKWTLEFGDVVKHDYPMQGCTATKGGTVMDDSERAAAPEDINAMLKALPDDEARRRAMDGVCRCGFVKGDGPCACTYEIRFDDQAGFPLVE